MHHVGNYDKAAFELPAAYQKHSQGYSRVTMVDHNIPGAVHTGLGLCKRDTFFFKEGDAPTTGSRPDFRDPTTRYLGHFDNSHMPPHSQLQMDGYRGSNIFGISLKMLVDRMLGSQHLTLFMVEFQPGGEGNIHDHPFEETYFFLNGEAEAILDGQKYHVKAGDYVWTSVGGTHGFFNKGNVPMRWLETQTPQPPNQQAFRFPADWAYLATKLEM